MSQLLRIAILHPDLGIGGAERLIVDAALELQRRGHRVTIFTGSHDPTRAFEETRDGTLDVRVHGEWLPLHLGGRLRLASAIAKMTVGAFAILDDADRPDVVLCDVVPHVIPTFRALRRRLPVLFYCHFPDQLLTPARRGLYRWYRAPFDALETTGTAMATRVMVNSRYTADVFARTDPGIVAPPGGVYPGADVGRWSPADASMTQTMTQTMILGFLVAPTADAFAGALSRLVKDRALANQMGAAGRSRVVSQFSRASFGARLEGLVRDAAIGPMALA